MELKFKDIVQIGKHVRNIIWVTFGQQDLLCFKCKWFTDDLDELPEECLKFLAHTFNLPSARRALMSPQRDVSLELLFISQVEFL